MLSPEEETELDEIEGITIDALDVTNAKQVKATAAKFGVITDVIHNNAGYGVVGTSQGHNRRADARRARHELHGYGPHDAAFLPYLRERRSGLFINTVSIGGVIAVPFSSSYFAHPHRWRRSSTKPQQTARISSCSTSRARTRRRRTCCGARSGTRRSASR